jgi:hypothetical protein
MAVTLYPVFRTRFDDAGVEIPGWFIAGINLPVGQITYHMPDAPWWEVLAWVPIIERNEQYDGHSAADVAQRLTLLGSKPLFSVGGRPE